MQQLGSKEETTELESRRQPDNKSDSKQSETQTYTEKTTDMNDRTSQYNNSVPYDDEVDWSLSQGGTKPSPVTAKRWSLPGIDVADDIGLATMNVAHEPSLMTREEQAIGNSYAQLASMRSANATALADGRIKEPHINDILCGRGGSINAHPGNRIFRGWITERKESYNLAESKADKSRITAEIMDRVQVQSPPGRFLQKLNDGKSDLNDPYKISGWWIEIDHIKSLAKISQALREGAPAFRALHGKKEKGRKKKNAAQRKSARTKYKKSDTGPATTRRSKRKAPPRTMEMASAAAMPRLPVPAMGNQHGHDLDVLFPTSNNFFSTESGSGTVLSSYPLVHMGDFLSSMDEVAGALPPTPPTVRKTRIQVPPATMATAAKLEVCGKCTSPNLLPKVPNTPLVSPYGEAKAAWDAISFLPNLSPGTHSDRAPFSTQRAGVGMQPSLQRTHSLSFSDGDVHSVGSFNDPFENDNNHNQERPDEFEAYMPPIRPSLDDLQDDPRFPPPLAQTPPHVLSFGRIGSVPSGPARGMIRHNSRHRNNNGASSHGSLSSRSRGSLTNLNRPYKRNSIW